MQYTIIAIIFIIILCLALSIKALRKASGLTMILFGFVVSLSGIGLIIGVPLIFIGAILLFI